MKKSGFTLIELLIVIAIIGILSSVAIVNLSRAKDKARLAKSLSFEATIRRSFTGNEQVVYNFDAGNAADSSGHSWNASVNGSVVFETAASGKCLRGRCVSFTGGYLRTPAAFVSPDKFVLSLWLYIDPADKSRTAYLFYNSNMLLYTGGNGYLEIDIGNLCSDSAVLGTNELIYGSWQHVAIIFDGNDLVFDLNGEEVGREENVPNLTCPGDDFRIGEGSRSRMDEVMFFSHF